MSLREGEALKFISLAFVPVAPLYHAPPNVSDRFFGLDGRRWAKESPEAPSQNYL